jgi:hypothetical protein
MAINLSALFLAKETFREARMNATNSADQSGHFSFSQVVNVLMLVALFTGLQGARYYAGNIAQELGIACSIVLFLIGSFFSFFIISRGEWNSWVILPVLLVGIITIGSGLTFALRYGGNPLFNIMAAREFLFIFLCPGVYLCCRAGYSTERFTNILWIVLIALMANYLFNYWRLDLKDMFFSTDHRIQSLVTYDEWRGFRLKPSLFALMVVIIWAAAKLFNNATPAVLKVVSLTAIAVAAYIWSIVLFRSTLATMLISLMVYPLFFYRPKNIQLLIALTPLVLILTPILATIVYQSFTDAEGGNVRLAAFNTALKHLPDIFVVGAGEDSAYGPTYKMLFGAKFYPSDLGLIGLTFKYGVVGLILYLYLNSKIIIELCKANWNNAGGNSSEKTLVWTLLIFFLALSINLLINTGLAYAQGITLGSCALALAKFIQVRD